MKNLLRTAVPLVVIALFLGLTAAPSSGQDPADFDFAVSYDCDSDNSVILTFTLTNNSDYGIEIYNAHLEPSGDPLDFQPATAAPGGSSSASINTGENPLAESFEVDILMYMEPQGAEGRLEYDVDAEYECEVQPSTTTTSTPSTTAAPAAAAQPAAAEPTFTG